MEITVIDETPEKGVTYYMKELFLSSLKNVSEITEFYPKDFPPFCEGCKNCFLKGNKIVLIIMQLNRYGSLF